MPTRSSSATRTSRCTSARVTFRSSIPAARPSAGAPPSTRWAWRSRATAKSSSSSSSSERRRCHTRPVDLSLFFAGTAGSIPTARRGLPAILVRRGADRILFDCGEGTQRQLVSTVGLPELTEIFITHFHADHWLGLPGMLKTFDLRARERPLTVYGPPGLGQIVTLGLRAAGRVRYELDLVELEPGQELTRDGYRIAPVPVDHRGPAYGYVLYEEPRPGEFDPDAAQALGIAPGPDFGRLQR